MVHQSISLSCSIYQQQSNQIVFVKSADYNRCRPYCEMLTYNAVLRRKKYIYNIYGIEVLDGKKLGPSEVLGRTH